MKEKTRIHPTIYDLKSALANGKLSRREFLRYATLLGMSAAAASQMIGLTWPQKLWAATPKRGGVLKISQQVQKIDHPARYSWLMPSNTMRMVFEYMTLTDRDNITHPYLCEKWSASDDLKTWTFNVRKGIKFNNGDTFTADDCIFTITEWLNKDVKSSLLGLVGSYLEPTGIEKVNDYQFKLNLKRPEIAIPEHFFQYTAQVVNHRTFEGDMKKKPHGTGPYLLDTYNEGEIAIVKARKDYWQKGGDGKPLPYMDEIRFIDMGGELAPQIAALKSGEIDLIDASDNPGPQVMMAVKKDAHINVMPVATATTRVMRMRVDMKPWSDNNVRMALKLCQNREKILALAYQGEGLEGQDFHVYPKHPEYCEMPVPEYWRWAPSGPISCAMPRFSNRMPCRPESGSIFRPCPPANTGKNGPRSIWASPRGRTGRWAPWCRTWPISPTTRVNRCPGMRVAGLTKNSPRFLMRPAELWMLTNGVKFSANCKKSRVNGDPSALLTG
jgi:peptide/nickel transport system substrate-binding protein